MYIFKELIIIPTFFLNLLVLVRPLSQWFYFITAQQRSSTYCCVNNKMCPRHNLDQTHCLWRPLWIFKSSLNLWNLRRSSRFSAVLRRQHFFAPLYLLLSPMKVLLIQVNVRRSNQSVRGSIPRTTVAEHT